MPDPDIVQGITSAVTAIASGLTNLTAITAALLGSTMTACLSYFVQQKLAKKRRREEEERLAFVYLVQITPFVAAEEIVKKIGDIYASVYGKYLQEDLDKIKSSDRNLDDAQAWCALIAAGMIEHIREKGSNDPIWPRKDTDFRGFSDTLDAYNIPLNLLSQMPRDAVVAYSEMQNSIEGIKTVIKQLETWQQSDEKHYVNAESLYAQWTRITALSKNAKTLREALISKGNVPRGKADEILRLSIIDGSHKIFGSWGWSSKLKAAETIARELLAEKRKEKQNNSDPQK